MEQAHIAAREADLALGFVRETAGIVSGYKLYLGPNARAFLPVEVTDGQVVARDGHGRPAIVLRPRGAGAMVLSSYPLEHLAASCGRVNPVQTWRLYSALAQCAGVESAVTVDSPEVLVDGLVHQDGRRFVWLVSEHDGPLVVHPRVRGGRWLTPLEGGEPIEQVELAPYGVTVLQLTTTEDESRWHTGRSS